MDLFGTGPWACQENSVKDIFYGDFLHNGVITPLGLLGEGRKDFGAIGSEVKLSKIQQAGSSLLFGGWSEKKDVGSGAGGRFGEVWDDFRRRAVETPLLDWPPVRDYRGRDFSKRTYSDSLSDGTDLLSGSDLTSGVASTASSSSLSSPVAGVVAGMRFESSRDRGRSSYRTPHMKRNQADMEDFIQTYGYGKGSEHPNNMIRPRKGKYFKEFEFDTKASELK